MRDVINAMEPLLYLTGILLTLCFPVYLAIFLYHLFKKRFDRLHYLTVIYYSLFFMISASEVWKNLSYLEWSANSEAKTYLTELYSSQIAYYGKFSTYAHSSNCFADLGWTPWGETRYTYYCGSDIFGPTGAGRDPAPFHPNTNWPSSVPKPEASSTSFTLVAIGNIDRDPDFNIWVINDAKILSNPNNDKDYISGAFDPYFSLGIVFLILAPLLLLILIHDVVKARKG